MGEQASPDQGADGMVPVYRFLYDQDGQEAAAALQARGIPSISRTNMRYGYSPLYRTVKTSGYPNAFVYVAKADLERARAALAADGFDERFRTLPVEGRLHLDALLAFVPVPPFLMAMFLCQWLSTDSLVHSIAVWVASFILLSNRERLFALFTGDEEEALP